LAGIGTVAQQHGCQGFAEPVLSTLLYKIILSLEELIGAKLRRKRFPRQPIPYSTPPQVADGNCPKNDAAKII
jgi:hypothetical protein